MPHLVPSWLQTFTPCVASKMLTLATLSKAVASSKGAGRGAIFLASLIADLIKVGGDAAALARSERVALSHVCAGGRNNLKHAVDMLPSDLVTERYAGLAAVAQLASMVEDVCMGGDVAPLREAVASVSEDVKKGTDFARAFLLEVVAAANQYALGDSAMYKESFGHLADMTFQFVDAARSQAGVDAAAFGVSMLNGMQLTLASDDALDPRTYVDAVECLLTPARGAWIVAPADVRAWAGESGDKVVPGRADAVSAVAELVASLA
ncbi:hypothetical protein EON62_02125 [archaeon]|nr:MAG: hypothetical protein EON62_02125 [archaeon]